MDSKFSLSDLPTQAPPGHEAFSFDDYSKCPMFNKNKDKSDPKKVSTSQTNKSNDNDKNKYSEDEPTTEEDESEQQTSGCPVIANSSKKNPRLELVETGHNLPYISKLHGLMGFKGIFDVKPNFTITREQWEKYPIYLKHTVFLTGTDMQKYRNLEIGHKFFVFDKLREKGNRRFLKGHYHKALNHYERALGI